MNDRVVVGTLLVAFAAFVTTHVTIAVALLRRAPRWRAPVAFAVPPLALYWAVREQMRVRSVLWVVSGVAYAVALFLASLTS